MKKKLQVQEQEPVHRFPFKSLLGVAISALALLIIVWLYFYFTNQATCGGNEILFSSENCKTTWMLVPLCASGLAFSIIPALTLASWINRFTEEL